KTSSVVGLKNENSRITQAKLDAFSSSPVEPLLCLSRSMTPMVHRACLPLSSSRHRNMACQGKRDCDVVHGEVHRSSPANMAELQSDCCGKTTSACNRCNRLSHAHSAVFRRRPSVRCASQLMRQISRAATR